MSTGAVRRMPPDDWKGGILDLFDLRVRANPLARLEVDFEGDVPDYVTQALARWQRDGASRMALRSMGIP